MRIDVTPEKSEARRYHYRILFIVRARVHACVGSYTRSSTSIYRVCWRDVMLCTVLYCIPECAGSYCTVRLYGCVHTAF